jgi:hypothetical protein
MGSDTLSTELSFAELSNNLAGDPSPLVEWPVPDGSRLTIRQGHPAIVDAETADNNSGPSGNNVEPTNSTRLGLAYREPNDPLDAYTVVSAFNIAPFNQLSLRDQNSGDNAERRRVDFDPDRVPGGVISLSDSDTLALFALSDDEIKASTLFFNYPMSFEEA